MIIEPDQYYYEDGVYCWTVEKRAAAWAEGDRRLADALATGRLRKVILLVGIPGAGKSTFAKAHDAEDVVIYDSMFIGGQRRRAVAEAVRRAGVPVEAVWCDPPLDVARRRNASRSPDRRIPDEILVELHHQLQTDPPGVAEGFASVQHLTAL